MLRIDIFAVVFARFYRVLEVCIINEM